MKLFDAVREQIDWVGDVSCCAADMMCGLPVDPTLERLDAVTRAEIEQRRAD